MPLEVHNGLGEPTKPPALFTSVMGEKAYRTAGPPQPLSYSPKEALAQKWLENLVGSELQHCPCQYVFWEMLMKALLEEERGSIIKQV